MGKQRFLRDHILQDMLKEIQNIADLVDSQKIQGLNFQCSVGSLAEMYETNKRVLMRLEQVIQKLRDDNGNEELIQWIVEAAAHMQIGLVSTHNALKEDLDQMQTAVSELRQAIEESEAENEES